MRVEHLSKQNVLKVHTHIRGDEHEAVLFGKKHVPRAVLDKLIVGSLVFWLLHEEEEEEVKVQDG